MSEWNGTVGTCRKCRGTGLYLADVESTSVRNPRPCLYCEGTGEIDKPPPPTAEQVAEARKAEIGALFDPKDAPTGPGFTEPPVPLPPRRAHCQRTDARARTARGGELGTVAWEEHVAACRARGVDPERAIAAGGLDYAAITLLLGYEPRTWERWGA